MKAILLLLLLIAFSVCKKHLKHHGHTKLRRFKKHQITPKAWDLDNHFGFHPLASPYGPQPNYQTYQITGGSGPITVIAGPGVTSQAIMSSACQISIQPAYEICRKLDCGLCASSPYCGYCSSTGQCLPGTTSSCSCPQICPSQFWSFSFCPTVATSGRLSNIAPEARDLISPEIAGPKAIVTTHEPVMYAQQSVVGTQLQTQHTQHYDPITGQTYFSSHNVATPIISQVSTQIGEKVQSTVYNLDGRPPTPNIIQNHGYKKNKK